MMTKVIEIYSSIECPFAYLAIYRLRQVWPEFTGRVQVVWRALSLEYINQQVMAKPSLFGELNFLASLEPSLAYQPWPHPEWAWPGSFWPAFEALACAQVQNVEAAWAMSWALRYGLFAQSRPISLRHELLAIAAEVAAIAPLNLARFEADWDNGCYKRKVIAESKRGWHELKVNGSATFVLPDGRQVTNPGVGQLDFDETTQTVRSYTPYPGEALTAHREMLQGIF
jgi:predicted DsbA family dithiol-disulfide isomerase